MGITNETTIDFLKKPLNMKRVKHRNQGGKELSYLEGHDVISCANYAFGFGAWGYELMNLEFLNGNYVATVKLTVENCIPVTDIGVSKLAKDIPESHDTAMKGAVTDGLKRCLRTFGNQFGNSLYSKD